MPNATTRLYEILSAIDSYKNINDSIKELWINIFDLKGKPEVEVYSKDADFRVLIYKAREEAEQHGRSENNPWLKHFDAIIHIFKDLSLKNKVHEIKGDKFPNALSNIETCGFAIRMSNPEIIVSKEEQEELIASIDELYEKAINVNFPSDLKIQILDNLFFAKKSIIDFKINGSKDIRRAVEANVGQIVLNQDKLNETQEGKDYINSSISLMSKINTLFSFYKNAQALYSGARFLLDVIL